MTDEQPTAHPCTCCGGDLERTGTTCRGCEDWLRDQLNDIEHLWQDLPASLEPVARGPRPSLGERIVRRPQPGRLPVSEDVLNLLGPGGVPDRLTVHDTLIRQARGLAPIPAGGTADARLAAVVGSLRRALPWVVEHHDTYTLAVELRALVGEMYAAGGGRSTTVALATPCPADGCGGELRFNRETRAVRCVDCGQPIDPGHWLIRPAA